MVLFVSGKLKSDTITQTLIKQEVITEEPSHTVRGTNRKQDERHGGRNEKYISDLFVSKDNSSIAV